MEKENVFLMGKWVYRGSCKGVSRFFENTLGDFKEKTMPNVFFMTRDNVGTDLIGENGKDHSHYISYTSRIISLNGRGKKQRNFWWLRGEEDYVILIEKSDKIHIYHRENRNAYTLEDIEKLLDERNKTQKIADFDDKLLGNWVIFDKIKENKVNIYNGEAQNVDDKYPELSPLFDCFEVKSPKEVHIMIKEDGDFQILGKVFTYDKAVMKMQMTGEESFYFHNGENNEFMKKEGLYKKIGEDEFIFVDVDKKLM